MKGREVHPSILWFSALVLAGCAGLNPNIGSLTADKAYQRGDCSAALEIYQKDANEGKPWAQLRLGTVYYEGRCLPKNDVTAMTWLRKAGAYESKTDWENGKDFSTGENGYFNTRASSANASHLIAVMYKKGAGVNKDLTKAWLWANRGLSLANEVNRSWIEAEFKAIEALMSKEDILNAKHMSTSWTPNAAP